MKKSKIILFLMTLFFNIVSFSQTTTIDGGVVVNNTSISPGATINLGTFSISNVNLAAKVVLPTQQSDLFPGTIIVYYQKNATTPAIIANGGNGGNLLFYGGLTTTRTFNITLDAAQFDLTGGFLYVEFKSYSGSKHKSGNVSIIKNGTVTPPPTSTTTNNIETIPYGGTPLLPEYSYRYNIKSQEWIINNSTTFEGIRNDKKLYTAGITELTEKTTYQDGSISNSDKISVRVVNFLPNYLDLYVNNKINNDQYLAINQDPQTIIGNQASESHTVKIEGSIRNQTVVNHLNNYQWQSRIKFPLAWHSFNDYYFYHYGWTDIPGATQINYTPLKSNRAIEYRRLVIENPADMGLMRRCASSNVVSIVSLNNDNTTNIICCDQTLKVNEIANTIIGDFSFNSFQWQISEDGINWKDIFGANKKDYNPMLIYTRGRVTNPIIKSQFYRRIVFNFDNNQHYSSNITKIDFETRSSSVNETIKIYPNPTTSILNIETTDNDFIDAKISIRDSTGNLLIPNNYSIVNSGLITLNVFNLNIGTYFISILKSGATRPITYTFIKN